jgi:hypothetical protein
MASKVRIRTIVDSSGTRAANSKPDDEFVLIINEGDAPAFMGGWLLLKKKPDSSHHDHYYFPETVEGNALVLKPGQEMLVMTGGGPYFSSEVVSTYIYHYAFTPAAIQAEANVGYASAAALFMGLMVMGITIMQLLAVRYTGRRRAELKQG